MGLGADGGHTDGEDGGGRQHSPQPAGKQCHEAHLSTSLRPGQGASCAEQVQWKDMKSEVETTVDIQGVVFDIDGTLLDNMPFHEEAFNTWAGRHGLPALTLETRKWMDGKRNRDIFPYLLEARDDRRRSGRARRREGIAAPDAVERPPVGAGRPRTPAATAPGARPAGGAGHVRAARRTSATRSRN